MRAFLEQTFNGEWLDDFVYISVYPLRERGYDVIPFDTDDLDNTLLNKNLSKDTDIIIGSVQSTTKFYDKIGIPIPSYLGYPVSLNKYLNRNIYTDTFGNVRKNGSFPLFIKPYKDVKLFTGELLNSADEMDKLQKWFDFDDGLYTYVSEPIDFLSEYRVFVHKGEIKGVKHYQGNFDDYIDIGYVRYMIDDYKDSPIAYTLDVGYSNKWGTTLVEVNDMWAIGSYGLKGKDYVRMVIDRHFEIVKG